MYIQDNKKLIAIVTPTYNREKSLYKLYKSLLEQTNKNFIWIIIDDGSTDNTKLIIQGFKNKDFKIKYIYKRNGGKHTALNIAFKIVEEELFFVVDSDDYLVSNAIEFVVDKWVEVKNKGLCGMSFLKGYSENAIVGDKFYKNEFIDNYINVILNKGIRGDKAEIWVTKYLKDKSFPKFKNEKFFGEGYIWFQVAISQQMLFCNKIIYLCNYMDDGLTFKGRVLRINCPNSGIEYSKLILSLKVKQAVRFKYAWLYVCYSLFAKKSIRFLLKNIKYKYFIFFNLPFGYMLYYYWKVNCNK